jgi:hypothetical protein
VEADQIIGDLIARGTTRRVATPLLATVLVRLQVYEQQLRPCGPFPGLLRWDSSQLPVVTGPGEDYFDPMKRAIGSGSALARRASPTLVRLLLVSTLAVSSATAIAADSAASSTQSAAAAAQWAPRKLHLVYMGFTSRYSCDGLQNQVKWILQQLGARDDLVVKRSGCTRLDGPEQSPGVEATFSVLEPAGEGTPSAGKSKDVAARWDSVTLNSDTPGRSNAGDCELIEQVKKQVLPLFTTRNPTYSSDCFPHSESLAGTRLSVEVLRPIRSAAPASAPR